MINYSTPFDFIIENIYNNAKTRQINRRNIRYSRDLFRHGPTQQGLAMLEELKKDFGWTIRYTLQ
ncbi:hypothetical protein [Chryseosolibacter indicus]|uniref:Uncharacterized protein n=1 Tax=Chryseosolibacter indicus TaxID=2782351 RepID=A0ABS5VSX4_9BACT|nr:hypothetical protein [Chryseosolibacter indicus]MBT1704530.1 hypothetical protein [Chryseosolibacter indicus]